MFQGRETQSRVEQVSLGALFTGLLQVSLLQPHHADNVQKLARPGPRGGSEWPTSAASWRQWRRGTKNNVTVVNVERDRCYTFPECYRLTNPIANVTRDALGLRKDDVVLLILDNDNFSLLHFSAIFKQEATFAFSNLRDSAEEHARQIDYVKPKAVFIETRMLETYYDRDCTIVAIDRNRVCRETCAAAEER